VLLVTYLTQVYSQTVNVFSGEVILPVPAVMDIYYQVRFTQTVTLLLWQTLCLSQKSFVFISLM